MSALDVAVIIVSWNVRDLLDACLRSVETDFAAGGLKGAIWLVDNASTDDTVAHVARHFPAVHIIANEENRGFGAANNQGLAAAAAQTPSAYFLLNPDTIVQPGAIRALLEVLTAAPRAGLVGPRLVYGDGRYQASAFRFPGLGQLAYDLWPLPARWYDSRLNGRYPAADFQAEAPPRAVETILGAAMLVRPEVVAATGGFDPAFHIYCEELDWCQRIRAAGWDIIVQPAAEIVHLAGASTRQAPAQAIINLWRSRATLYQRHHGRLTRWAAGHLARRGLRRQARGATGATAAAYASAADAWANV